jgi:hypothetical protein
MKTIAIAILSLVALCQSTSAVVVVNEVLSNEPGTESSLEWIELYNPGATAANLLYYQLHVPTSSGTAVYTLSGSIEAGGYLVVCRDSVRFEEHWGDSSGTWGNDPGENFAIRQLSFSLSNSSGSVSLSTDIPTQQVSQLAWTETGMDGYSWERWYYTSADIAQSVDVSGATPGRLNSITPLSVDLALGSVEVLADNGKATLGFRIINRGLTAVVNPILELYEYNAEAPNGRGDMVALESIGEIDSGLTVLLVGQYQFDRYYQPLVADIFVVSDARESNNRLIFTAPGADYPPVVLNEFLPKPDPDTASEWIELKNVSDTTINLLSWQFGDSTGLAAIASSELLIHSQEYIVVAQDTAAFRQTYPAFTGILHQPPSWRTLNNTSDSVRLVDGFDIPADQFYYESTSDSNLTWARSETGEYEGQWGQSEDVGGTPGEANRVRFTPQGSRTLKIDITPQIISPDGDGRDDSTIIAISISEADSYIIRLYDSQGRLVRTLEDGARNLKEHYVWRGETDQGGRVPIGIYILYVEAVGVESGKKTIVVAR